MEKVGVEAVVEGLSSFIRDTGKLNDALDGIRPKGTLLMQAFDGITSALGAFGREVLNVAEYALGHLLADAIEWVVTKLKELIGATIEAGAEFQTMQLRLDRLNLNSIIEGQLDYVNVSEAAKKATQEQLKWIQMLAVQTPYDFQDIANVFTLARSYGFASDAAKGLTGDITNFASGMGLGNTEIQRIIVNFGQMVQQGKVTQRELNDLARGSFVPVNDIMKRVGENIAKMSKEDLTALSKATGISTANLKKMGDGTTEAGKNLDELRKHGESVNLFMTAFSNIVRERFGGAASDMAKTFQGATANAQDFIKSLVGFGVVRPVLDAIGTKIAGFISELTSEKNWDRLTAAADRVGKAITGVVESIFGLMPSVGTMADRLIAGLNGIADWVESHRNDIWAFFVRLGYTIRNQVIPFVKKIVDAFNAIKDWVQTNRETISRFFTALGDIIAKVFNIDTSGAGGFLEGFLNALLYFMGFVIANQDAIAVWAERILKAVVAFEILKTVLVVVGGIVMAVVGFFLGLVAAIASVVAVVTGLVAAIATPIGAVAAIIGAAIVFVISMFTLFASIIFYCRDSISNFVETAKARFQDWNISTSAAIVTWVTTAITKFEEFRVNALTKFDDFKKGVQEKIVALVKLFQENIEIIKDKFLNAPWGTIGRLIVEGMRTGVMHAAGQLAAAAVAVVNKAIAAAKAAAGIKSPSKEGIYIGEMTMAGIAKGLLDGADTAMRAMDTAVSRMAMPAMNLPAITQQYAVAAAPSVSNTNNYTNNWNLTVNSNAASEPIIQDYNLMQSLFSA